MIDDGTWRYFYEGQHLNRVSQLGTFAERMVCHESSLVKIDQDVSLKTAALVSCGVATGYGSTVNRGGAAAGDVVVVVGCGGVGSGALLGGVSAGASAVVAVDPLEYKRTHAIEIGATHTAASMTEAFPLLQDLTRGVIADVVVLTPGTVTGEMIGEALQLTAKGGNVVCTGMSPTSATTANISLFNLAMSNKAVLGSLFGSASPRRSIPHLLGLHAAGKLDVDALYSKEYELLDVDQGYRDLMEGNVIRGVLDLA